MQGDSDLVVVGGGIHTAYRGFRPGGSSDNGDGIHNQLYINDGHCTLDRASVSDDFATDLSYSWAVALGDVDGDHDLDLFVANTRGSSDDAGGAINFLYLNDGSGHFSRQRTSILESTSTTCESYAAAFLDFDGDGQ